MPSGRQRERRNQDAVTFFLDRSIGRVDVAQAFTLHGVDVVLMSDLYPYGLDQEIDDERWIADVSLLGYIAVTKDSRILRDHRGALERSTLRLFAIDSARMTGKEMAARVDLHLNRILRRARKPGPYFYVIQSSRIELGWRPDS
jgi:hypothetical protein